MTDRRQSGSGGQRRDSRKNGSQTRSSAAPPTLGALGASLLHHWEMAVDGSPYLTVVSGNVSALVDRVSAGGVNMVQGTAGARPAYHANGFGPNSLPWLELQDANRVISAAISIAAANRASVYCVCKCGNNNGFVTWVMDHAGGGQTRLLPNATQYVHRAEFTAGTQIRTITSVAKNTSEHMHAYRVASTGAANQLDGANLVQAFTGSSTLLEVTAYRFGAGGGGSDSGAGMWATFIVDDAIAARDTIIKQYAAYYTGLTFV